MFENSPWEIQRFANFYHCNGIFLKKIIIKIEFKRHQNGYFVNIWRPNLFENLCSSYKYINTFTISLLQLWFQFKRKNGDQTTVVVLVDTMVDFNNLSKYCVLFSTNTMRHCHINFSVHKLSKWNGIRSNDIHIIL